MGLCASAQEFRGFWADAFHSGFKTPAQVSQLIADLRGANCNAVVVEVRKRGDAYYHSHFEPIATDISPADFDPLRDLLDKAHDTNAGARIEVHAWLVTYPIWNSQTPPPQADHPYRLHPEWLTQDTNGNQWVTNNYVLDPGHPGVLQHNFNVALDIITNYPDVDGINFDYIRYPESGASATNNPWGYNPVSVERFNRLRNHSGQPLPTDPDWLDFRRQQVTALLRKVYLTAMAVSPGVKISADTITWAPGVTTTAEWLTSAGAYVRVLQDWRGWMEEGILDLNIQMTYFRQPGYASDYAKWNGFAKDHRYNRHAVVGPGIYLNSISNAIAQMRLTRDVSPGGKYAEGVCGYSYAVPASNQLAGLQEVFLAALTQPSAHDSMTPPLFETPATVPVMPWKVAPTRGHLMGVVVDAATHVVFDGLALTLTGPATQVMTTDGTGFYGAVDLLPGNYVLTVTTNGYAVSMTNIVISAGSVASCDLELVRETLPTVVVGAQAAIVSWSTVLPSSSQVEYWTGTNAHQLSPLLTNLVQQHSVLLPGLLPDTIYCCAAVSQLGLAETRSGTVCVQTAGKITLDNVDAALDGNWTTSSSSSDKYLGDYCYATAVSGTATRLATYTPTITTPGLYDIYIWYPQGNNRSACAPHFIYYEGGSQTISVNQQINGGGWQLLTQSTPFGAGTNGYLQIGNNTGESGKVVIADGVRFIYSDGQEPPVGLSVPRWWAQYYFSSNIDTLTDYNGNGYPVWAEFWLGLDPTDAGARLKFRAENFPDSRVIFSPFLSDRRYDLQVAFDPAGPWQTLSNLTVQRLTNDQAAISFAPTNANRYFRLKVDWNR